MRIFLSLSDAVHLAGRAIYGDDWIAGLTPRERDTLIQYPVGGAQPDDPKLRAVIARARHRDGRMTVQRGRALAWLSSSDEFDTHHPGKRIDRESLERALARDFRAERHGARPVDKVASAGSTSAVRPPSTPDGERANDGDGAEMGTGTPARASKLQPGPVPTAVKIAAGAGVLLAKGRVPAKTITWEQFRTELCRHLKVKPEDRGYSLDTIQAAVRPLLQMADTSKKIESTEITGSTENSKN